MIEKGPKLFAISSNFKAAMNDNDNFDCKKKMEEGIYNENVEWAYAFCFWSCVELSKKEVIAFASSYLYF